VTDSRFPIRDAFDHQLSFTHRETTSESPMPLLASLPPELAGLIVSLLSTKDVLFLLSTSFAVREAFMPHIDWEVK
jgi:hypothetical protein